MIRFRRYPGLLDSDGVVAILPWYYLRVWLLSIEFHRSMINYHDHSGPRKPITRGWRLINLKTANGNHGTGYSFRIIKYWPSGAWWHVDLNWNRKRDN